MDKLENEYVIGKTDRRSIYRDVKMLQSCGYPIEQAKDKKQGWYMEKHAFDDWEIKVMMDAAQQARCVSVVEAKNIREKLLGLGSMNASYSAINKNVEMMLWLGTKNKYLNGEKFLKDIFCGPADDEKNPFEKVTVMDAVQDIDGDNKNALEQKIKELCRAKRKATITEDNYGKYKVTVEFPGVTSDKTIMVSPFNSKQEHTLCEKIEFTELEILQLSEFYELAAKDRASFVEYIAFVLGDDYLASMLEKKQIGESGIFQHSNDAMSVLYEKMLKTSVEEPERFRDIGYVLKMVTDKEIIPDEFREPYDTFCNTLKIRR